MYWGAWLQLGKFLHILGSYGYHFNWGNTRQAPERLQCDEIQIVSFDFYSFTYTVVVIDDENTHVLLYDYDNVTNRLMSFHIDTSWYLTY